VRTRSRAWARIFANRRRLGDMDREAAGKAHLYVASRRAPAAPHAGPWPDDDGVNLRNERKTGLAGKEGWQGV
jgi:hypothetical protein